MKSKKKSSGFPIVAIEAQEYSEEIFRTIREAVIVLNNNFQVKMANRAFYRIFNINQEEIRLEGEFIYDLPNGQWNSPKLRELLNNIMIDGKEFDGFEIEHDFPGIGEKIMLLNGIKVTKKIPGQELILLTMEDVTEHKVAQRLALERENWFKNIADNAPMMIWMSDINGLRHFFNTTWLHYTNRSFEEAKSNGWMSEMHPDDLDRYIATYHAASNARNAFTIEYRLRRNDNEYRWFLETGKPAFLLNKNFSGYIGSCIEVHDKKLIQEELEKEVNLRTLELQKLNKELGRSNGELQQLAYVASHDLQEPLRKIMTFSDRLGVYVDGLPEIGKTYIEKIAASAERMSTLIDNLLDFSRISRDNKFIKTDLNEVLEKVLIDFELIISEKRAKINKEIYPFIEAIPIQIEQLFHNLISNALKFSKEGNPPIITIWSALLAESERIAVGLSEDKQYVEIVFEDNGIGFNNEFAEQIFVIFQRLNERNKYPGTGIGLSLCRGIAENHKGKIFATSMEDKGSAFHVILPLEQ